jgi:hypothetical protein
MPYPVFHFISPENLRRRFWVQTRNSGLFTDIEYVCRRGRTMSTLSYDYVE